LGKKIVIEPITRIEGHAKVTIHLDDEGNVEKSYFHVNQFRGFEKFCEGRLYFEMPQITPRICGICPVSHHLASAKATDEIIEVEIPKTAKMLRELMHMGQFIQSHSMHFFHLASPDLLLGFDADPAIRNVVGIINKNPELAITAVKLRKFGQDIIEILGKKKVHPIFAVPGGVNNALSVEGRDKILSEVEYTINSIKKAIEITKDWMGKNKELVDSFANFKSGYMGLVKDGALEIYDGNVRLVDEEGNLLEEFNGSDYLNYVAEHVEDWSYLKFPYYKKMGYPEGCYRVGPLGRLNVCDRISTPLANDEFKLFKTINNGKPVEASMYFHYARLIEDLYAAERTKELLEDPDILSTDIRTESTRIIGEGVGTIEAPRGTLFHHYKTDENGVIQKVNLIIATGHNNWAMSKSVDMVAKQFISGKEIREGLLNRVEAAIRCYDPCLSCSTHALGQMPLYIEIQSSNGEIVETIKRD
jgi:NAD-reducing hydrogenase large subunit